MKLILTVLSNDDRATIVVIDQASADICQRSALSWLDSLKVEPNSGPRSNWSLAPPQARGPRATAVCVQS